VFGAGAPKRAARAVGNDTTVANGAGPRRIHLRRGPRAFADIPMQPPRRFPALRARIPSMSTRRCQGPGGGQNPPQGQLCAFSAPLQFTGTAALRAASLQAPGDSVPAVHLLSVPARSRSPHSLFAAKRVWEARGEGPHLTLGQPGRPGIAPGPRTRSCGACLDFSQALIYAAFGCACFFSTAPAGGVPVCRYFQSSIRSFRASATIPIFRSRALPLAYRSRYHRLNSLSGW